ncbi:hypothetical protein [Streptomyces avicenniae]|uniref:hypothetical protein n=1 Tax=Streptomyces avicenniae TaxID=500153 RepID=UPI00069A9C13|nr:hypothetical protein [Streptomyces avicenniae]
MTTGEFARLRLDDDQRADVGMMRDRLRAAGWRVRQVTTRTDEPMVMEPAAGARYETRTCALDVEYVAMGLSVAIEDLGGGEDHELLVHCCGPRAGRHTPSPPDDDRRELADVLAVLTAYQDRLTPDVYAAFCGDLLVACGGAVEYHGDESGMLCDVTREGRDAGELPVAKGP